MNKKTKNKFKKKVAYFINFCYNYIKNNYVL